MRELTGVPQAFTVPSTRSRTVDHVPKVVYAQPRLLDRVCEKCRLRHYSRRTEEAYVGWIRRFILFQRVKSRHSSSDGRVRQRDCQAGQAIANARLSGIVQDDRLPYEVTRFEWTKVSGPGEIKRKGFDGLVPELHIFAWPSPTTPDTRGGRGTGANGSALYKSSGPTLDLGFAVCNEVLTVLTVAAYGVNLPRLKLAVVDRRDSSLNASSDRPSTRPQ